MPTNRDPQEDPNRDEPIPSRMKFYGLLIVFAILGAAVLAVVAPASLITLAYIRRNSADRLPDPTEDGEPDFEPSHRAMTAALAPRADTVEQEECSPVVEQHPFTIEMRQPEIHDHFAALEHQWEKNEDGSRANNGVIIDNLSFYFDLAWNNFLTLIAHGQRRVWPFPRGVDENGEKVNSAKKVGAAIVSKKRYSYGRVNLQLIGPPPEGVTTVFEVSDGHNSHAVGMTLSSETSQQQVLITSIDFFTRLSDAQATHEFKQLPYSTVDFLYGVDVGIDWHPERTDFYINDVKITSITTTNPSKPGRVLIGLTFTDQSGEGDVRTESLRLRNFTYTPYSNMSAAESPSDEIDTICEFMHPLPTQNTIYIYSGVLILTVMGVFVVGGGVLCISACQVGETPLQQDQRRRPTRRVPRSVPMRQFPPAAPTLGAPPRRDVLSDIVLRWKDECDARQLSNDARYEMNKAIVDRNSPGFFGNYQCIIRAEIINIPVKIVLREGDNSSDEIFDLNTLLALEKTPDGRIKHPIRNNNIYFTLSDIKVARWVQNAMDNVFLMVERLDDQDFVDAADHSPGRRASV